MTVINSGSGKEVTVVIPTIGNSSVLETINSLNSGTEVPHKILVCVPDYSGLELPLISNVEIFKASAKGQVQQRCEGFRQSATRYTLQLDDDITLQQDCLEKLLQVIKEKSCSAVSPAFLRKNSSISLYSLPTDKFINKLYYWLLNGSRGFSPGTVTLAGTGFGVDFNQVKSQSVIKCEWLPGGCMLHETKNLILENFYPYSGKAFSEDLVHSWELSRKGINFFIQLEAFAEVGPQPALNSYSLHDFYAYIRGDFKARRHYVKRTDRSMCRLVVYYLSQILVYLGGRLADVTKLVSR